MRRSWLFFVLFLAIPAMAQILPGGLGSRWWRSTQWVERLNLTPDQQAKMDDVFQQNRLKLIDLTATLDKEEAILEPLVSAEQPDADKIRSQISRVADARASLEKGNANMLLGLRLVLKPDQWKILDAAAKASDSGPRPRKLPNGGDTSRPNPKKQLN
jgi:Spy/CpxP family protein refolding chaperone